jgi:hypothetical protein
MATSKTFCVAGVSTLNGKTKIRFANDIMRIKILAKNGHEDINLVNLPHEMTKGEIAQHLREIGFMSEDQAVQDAIAYIARKNPVANEVTESAVVADTVVA